MEHSPPRRHVFVRRAVLARTLGEKLFRLLRETAIKWSADKAARLGAALAYYTIFSLAPLLIIAILISGAVPDAPSAGVPTLVIHGTHDTMASFEEAWTGRGA